MNEQMNEINQLLKRYRLEIEILEKQLKAKKEKINTLYETIKILEEEKIIQPSLSQSASESISDKYKDISMNKAIIDLLSDSDKFLDGNEVFNELMKNGFVSASSNIKRDVFIALYRLDKKNMITSKKMENRKKYIVPLT